MPVRSGRDATMNFEKLAKQIPTFVTVLPSQPSDGQEVYFQNAEMATIGCMWHLRYRATSVQANKWEFVGGSPLDNEVFTEEGTKSGANVDLATVGPKVTVPVQGTYYVSFSVRMINTGADTSAAELVVSGVAAGLVLVYGITPAASQVSCARLDAPLELALGAVVKLQYRTTGAIESKFTERSLSIRPIRVG